MVLWFELFKPPPMSLIVQQAQFTKSVGLDQKYTQNDR